MNRQALAHLRLANQQIALPRFQQPGDVVAWLGAVQAQDYESALWAIGLRLPAATRATIEQAIADGAIVRTWPMRGTLHFVAAADVRWMLDLLAPRALAGSAGRRKELGIDAGTLGQSRALLIDALQGGRQRTRSDLLAFLEAAGIATDGQRGIHILGHMAQTGLICLGPRQGKQSTFVLLDEWVPQGPRLLRDEALTLLARRYTASHGPATVQDLAWWAGLAAGDVRAGLEAASGSLLRERVDGIDYWMAPAAADAEAALRAAADGLFLLPSFDEYLLGYRDRSAVLDPAHERKVKPGGGVFRPVLVSNGLIAGVWSRTQRKRGPSVAVDLFAPLDAVAQARLASVADQYSRFTGAAPE